MAKYTLKNIAVLKMQLKIFKLFLAIFQHYNMKGLNILD